MLSARGGGISRKIINLQDRKRLKEIVKELEVPKGMGVILRTAGANRTKAEIKRDYEYLIRLWENVRTLTLDSIAPTLVYEEGSLIKRSIRDLYNKDIDEVLVAGENGYREAKDFMRMLMPSHAKVVQPYREKFPIFARNGIEIQLDKLLQPQVTLKSGGYLVINQTEALVAIDVNSGRSTKENSIEETAYQTNLEAAEEVARQLRLRDLAGLVVIDFIDMEEKRNIRSVEKKLKDCLKADRARIQVGRISHFGLMEMSRQRIRASVLESTTQPCLHCNGTGYVRSQTSLALYVIRAIEEYLLRNSGYNITVRTAVSTALYVLNHKRYILTDLENRFGLSISIEADDNVGEQHVAIYKGTAAQERPHEQIIAEEPIIEEVFIEASEDISDISDLDEQSQKRRKRRRRRGQKDDTPVAEATAPMAPDNHGEEKHRKRRRGRRGGRRNKDNANFYRLPFAEPVGPFAEEALKQVKQARRNRYIPKAEPVGEFALSVTAVQPIAADIAPPAPQAMSAPQEASPQKPARRKRRSAKSANIAVENTGEQASTPSPQLREDLPAKADQPVEPSPVDLGQNAVTVDAAEKAVSADKKPKRRGRKPKAAKDATEGEAPQTTDAVSEAPAEEAVKAKEKKPARPRKPRQKVVKENTGDTQALPEQTVAETKVEAVRGEAVVAQPSTPPAAVEIAVKTQEPLVTSSQPETVAESTKPRKFGWWQRRS